MENTKFLGCIATDKITTFAGIVTAHCSYITGCDQVSITEQTPKGESKWFDVNRVDITEKKQIELETSEHKGADVPHSAKG